jgi:hypothetical protein
MVINEITLILSLRYAFMWPCKARSWESRVNSTCPDSYFRRMSFGPRYGKWTLVVPAVFALAWVSVVGYQGLNGQDAHDYYRIAQGWQAYFVDEGERPIMAEHPHGYPILGAVLGFLVGPLWALRIISVVSFVGLVLILHRMLRRNGVEGEVAQAYILLGVALSPFLLRYALTTMSDVLAIAFTTAAFGLAIAWMRDRVSAALLGMIGFLALALSVRIAVAPIAALLLMYILGERVVARIAPRTLAIIWTITLVAGSITVTALQQNGTLLGTPLAEWTPLNWFRRDLHSDDGVLHYMVPNILYACGVIIHPGHFTIGLLVVPFFRWKDLADPLTRLAGVLLCGYLLFIAGMPFQNDRVLLLALPFTVVLFHQAFLRAYGVLGARTSKPGIVVVVLAVVQCALFVRAMVPFIRQAQVERDLSALALQLSPQHLYTHGMGAALHTYCPGVPVTELWYTEIDDFDHGAVLVVHPENLAAQWAGHFPAINWDNARTAGAIPVFQRSDGWVIARVP